MKGDMEAKLREFEKIYTLTTTEKRKTDLLSKASLEYETNVILFLLLNYYIILYSLVKLRLIICKNQILVSNEEDDNN